MTCRPMPERAVCSVPDCTYGDPIVTEIARQRLHAALTNVHTAEGCRCARCADNALTDAEAEVAVAHVPDRLAVLFSMSMLRLGGMIGCEHCGGWLLGFHLTARAPWDALEHTGCPRHRHAHRFVHLGE